MDWLREAPFGWAYLFLFLLSMARANTTYWVGRGVAAGVSHSRFEYVLEGPIYRRAQRFVARWGILAVPLSFLTIGIQTAVNASAGMSRMPLSRYLPAVIVGCLMWALIYATVGMAVVYAALAVGWQWIALAGVVVVAGAVLWIRYRRRNG
ncbi:MAG: DedA family protein [Arthrobacter sp.]|uniref:DedA family protein n=1 Tax=Arthrobacter sp. AOP36-A1-22 TaxID=3457684 RepID=UPI00265022EB|nr:VTT domain-containing protein [Micrococcaceae bacterium]MDN5812392.1 VTT domain-containing protein [Micrococcaceae bacterium]MDN5823375.1 VTT domain-containing protein [Micrococcaceae bacterium]MDN5885903.1 VTT domain-containing protein [Micrococcaceae bacterium]MDN5905109.1 VTT domain-containing protein [Micrococcaceae bacterium]